MSDSTEHNKELLRRYVDELWSQGKLEVADEIIHPNTRNDHGTPMWENGPESVKQAVNEARVSAPDLARKINAMVAEDNVIVVLSTITGTHTSSDGNIKLPPTGVKLSMTGVATFEIEDGKIVAEPWNHWNFGDITVPLAKAFATRWFEDGWSSRDPEVVRQFFDEDYVGHIFGGYPGQTGQGRDAVVNLFRMMWGAFPDLEVCVEDMLVDGDKISSRIVMGGTPEQEFFGYQPTGKRVRREGVMTFRLGPRSFVEGWATWGPFIED